MTTTPRLHAMAAERPPTTGSVRVLLNERNWWLTVTVACGVAIVVFGVAASEWSAVTIGGLGTAYGMVVLRRRVRSAGGRLTDG
jgi:hypothetical protein